MIRLDIENVDKPFLNVQGIEVNEFVFEEGASTKAHKFETASSHRPTSNEQAEIAVKIVHR